MRNSYKFICLLAMFYTCDVHACKFFYNRFYNTSGTYVALVQVIDNKGGGNTYVDPGNTENKILCYNSANKLKTGHSANEISNRGDYCVFETTSLPEFPYDQAYILTFTGTFHPSKDKWLVKNQFNVCSYDRKRAFVDCGTNNLLGGFEPKLKGQCDAIDDPIGDFGFNGPVSGPNDTTNQNFFISGSDNTNVAEISIGTWK